jgi:hypothetical protein
MARTQDFHSCNMGSIPVQITWFVGVTVTSQIVDLMPWVQLPYEPRILRLGVMATRHSHKVEDFSSSLEVATVDFVE